MFFISLYFAKADPIQIELIWIASAPHYYYWEMRKQYFGLNEKSWSDEEWLEVAKQMKHSPYTRLRYIRMIFEAEHQSSRFERIAFGSGVFFFLALLKFPVIRIQPGFRRVGLSGALSFGIYAYINSIAEEMKVKRIKSAYRKQLVAQQAHHRITI